MLMLLKEDDGFDFNQDIILDIFALFDLPENAAYISPEALSFSSKNFAYGARANDTFISTVARVMRPVLESN